MIEQSFDQFSSSMYQLQTFYNWKYTRIDKQKMKTETENNGSGKLTIFKPPGYIYKLSRGQIKNAQKQQYEIYFNNEHSLRKYRRSLNISNQSELQLYEWRKQSSCPIVKVVYLQLVKRTMSSSTPQNTLIDVNVYTENIEKILADMINLTLTEAIYVLKQSLLAYQELFSKFTAVSINKFYIGLNAQGKFKVWINQNFSLNCNTNISAQLETPINEAFTSQTSIVGKILHMVNLLANTSCKHFFYGLEKSLSIKKFSFDNSLQYIDNFIAKTKNIEIPTNLIYMLPKISLFCFDRSSVNFSGSNAVRKNQNERKQTTFSNLSATNSFRQLGSVARLPNRKNTYKQNENMQDSFKQNKLRSKRHSQKLPLRLTSTLQLSKFNHKNSEVVEKESTNPRQRKISLQIIMEKNRKKSVQSKEVLETRKSNISLQKQRPSICIAPTFLTNSTKGNQKKELKDSKSYEKNQNKAKKPQKPHSLESSKTRGYHSIANSKVDSFRLRILEQSCKADTNIYQTQYLLKNSKHEAEMILKQKEKREESRTNLRVRSASANITVGSCKAELMAESGKQKQQQSFIIQAVNSDQKEILSRLIVDGDKTSVKSISNQGTTKRRSFLTKTNYDSNAEDNDKNFSSSRSRMDFSSMSIQYRITNKNFDSEMTSSKMEETKRSLLNFKYGFEQIMENPSCKEVEEENETKSYNGSSLRNTQNIEQKIIKINKKNDETSSNNYSFGNNSNMLSKRKHLNESVQEDWQKIKEKNDQTLMNNQWKKTINNLDQLDDMALNQSIVDVHDEIIERDPYPDVRLEKLDRLGRQMCYSIVNKSGEDMEAARRASAKLKSQLYQIF